MTGSTISLTRLAQQESYLSKLSNRSLLRFSNPTGLALLSGRGDTGKAYATTPNGGSLNLSLLGRSSGTSTGSLLPLVTSTRSGSFGQGFN